MKLLTFSLLASVFTFTSCVEPEEVEVASSHSETKTVDSPIGQSNNSGIGIKNYLQLNNTYSQMTGINRANVAVKSEYDKVYVQLPSTSNPSAVSGFNQIATIRLSFAYCNKYIDDNYSSLYRASRTSASDQARSMVDQFIDIDYVNNEDDRGFLEEVTRIISNDDLIVSGSPTTETNNRKLLKLSCTSILSSSYVTMI